MGLVQDCPVSTNMISNLFVMYHMKVNVFCYNLASKKNPNSKIHVLTISGQMSLKPPIVLRWIRFVLKSLHVQKR